MIESDLAAHNSALRYIAPVQKGIVAIGLLLLCLLLNRPIPALILLLAMSVLTVGYGRVDWRVWMRLVSAEFIFILLSIGTIVFDPFQMSLQENAYQMTTRLIFRTLGAVSCLNFLALTTPLHELVKLAKQWRVPDLLIDLMLLTYRFLWTLRTQLSNMRTAQAARLGYSTRRLAMRSAGLLAARLFVQTYQRVSVLNAAYQARNGEERLPVWFEHEQHWANWLTAYAIAVFTLMTAIRIVVG